MERNFVIGKTPFSKKPVTQMKKIEEADYDIHLDDV